MQPARTADMNPRRDADSYGRRLRVLLRRRAYPILGFVALIVFLEGTRSWSEANGGATFGEGILTAIRVNFSLIVAGALAPCFVEAATARPVVRALASIVLAFLIVALAALAVLAFADGPIAPQVRRGAVLSNQAFLLRSWWLCSVAGLLFAAYCQAHDTEIETLRAARRAELERARSQRDVLAARLQVMQARVEPELLFGALGDVQRAYLKDPLAAGALLDDLIAYLRAALPQMRESGSTLGREVALAEAFLKVVPAGRSGQLAVEVRLAPSLLGTTFPPMVLLPLAHAACEVGPATITIEAPADPVPDAGRMASVAMRLHGAAVPAGWDEDALLPVRSVLHHHFGAAASVRVVADAAASAVVVAWPVPVRPDLLPADPPAATRA